MARAQFQLQVVEGYRGLTRHDAHGVEGEVKEVVQSYVLVARPPHLVFKHGACDGEKGEALALKI